MMLRRYIYFIKRNKKKVIILLSILFVNIVIFTMFFLTIPKINLDGGEIVVDVNNRYVEPGYKAHSIVKDVTDNVRVIDNINNKKIGTYYVDYSVKYLFFVIKSRRVVKVIDRIKPEIKLNGNDEVRICPNKEFVEPGYSAIDNYDGDLTSNVDISKKDDSVIYKVSDKSGNTIIKTRKVLEKDDIKPEIKLKGSGAMTIYVGDIYSEPGYSATDNCDGDLTDKVVVSGSVNNKVAGSYTINYKVKDESGNEVNVSRTVTVKTVNYYSGSSGVGNGIIYLTFDDGPNEGTTNVILDILKQEGVKATFFVTCNGPDYLINRMYNEGHVVALHTATHNYNYVYASANNYFDDLSRVSSRVKRLTGIDSKIIRFPGGSSNTISARLSKGIMTTLTREVTNRGYKYFDWNIDSNDAAGAGRNAVYNNVVNGLSHSKTNVVLMHDVKTATRDAIRDIIKYGKANGYSFDGITISTPQVKHGVVN